MRLLPLISRLSVGIVCFLVGAYVLSQDRKSPGTILLSAGLLLLGADSAFFNIYAALAVARISEPQYSTSANIVSTVSSILTLVHWSLILSGVVLTTRSRTRG
jgi:hypothetical protein